MMGAAVLWGTMLGFGAALIASWFFARRPSLEDRIAPFVRSTTGDEVRRREATVTPVPTLERLLAPAMRDAARAFERWGVAATDLDSRLRRAGSRLTPEQFRAQQVAWAAAGLAAGCLLGVALQTTRGTSILVLAILVLVLTVTGMVARDWYLTSTIKRRARRIVSELPTMAELLALAVAAGESVPAALERVATSTRGEMATELRTVLARVRAGERLTEALARMATDAGVPALQRFVDGVVTALERGTPLAEVLRAQAQDVRAAGQQELMEEGGRREIAMMVPVVFLILPVTVIFAVFPGLVAIDLAG